MGQGVVRVFKLLGNEDLRVFRLHFHGAVQALLHAFANVSGIMDELDFRPVMTDQLPPLLTDGVRHDDDCPVAFDRTDQRQADALVAAGGLHDDAVRGKETFLFRLFDHIQRGAGFDGAADVQRFHLDQDLGTAFLRHPVQPDHGCIAHRVKDCVIYHNRYTSGNYPITCRAIIQKVGSVYK